VLENQHALVHADFSPKNLLVYDDGLMLVDFETGHYGDPAFDLGFFLSHLVLKLVYHAPETAHFLGLITGFWEAYLEVLRPQRTANELRDLERRAVLNLAGCLWARLEGKSKIEYLTDTSKRDVVRRLARSWLYESPDLTEALQQLNAAFNHLEPNPSDHI
jgi:5-methylthioribose kinase